MRKVNGLPGYAELNRSWRLAATAICFVTFGVGGLIVAAVVFPVISLVSGTNAVRQHRTRAVVGITFRAFLWLMRVLGVANFDIEAGAREKLSSEHGTVVVANHPTLIDVIFLLGYVDQSNCVVKAALWKNPFLGLGVRSAGYIPNSDLETLMLECERTLRAGECLIVFPEATRTVPGQPIRLQRGAASIAVRAGAPVRIVHFKCEPPTLSKSDPWYRIPKTKPCYSMKVGGSLHARDFGREGEPYGVAARRLTRALHDELSRDVFAG